MRVYVAGAWVEKKERAEVYIAKLRAAGVAITHDWTVDEIPVTVDTEKNTDAQLPPGEREKRAKADLTGIDAADVLWLLAPNERGASGAWTEFGYGLALREARERTWSPLVVIASGVGWQRTIFTSQADRGFLSDEDALGHVLNLAAVHQMMRDGRSPDLLGTGGSR